MVIIHTCASARGASTIGATLTVAGVPAIRMSGARWAPVENAAVADVPSHGPVIPIDPAPPMVQERLPVFVKMSENAILKPPRGATGPIVAVSTCGSQDDTDFEVLGDIFDLTWLPERDPDVVTLGEDAMAIPLRL